MPNLQVSPLLTIASVIKPPALGFDKTVASVRREFAGAADIEFFVKVKDGAGDCGSAFDFDFPCDLDARVICLADAGVFDGMNQALAAATGDWILFLNAGDWLESGFADAFRAAVQAHPDADFLCFDGLTVDAADGRAFKRTVPEVLEFSSFLRRMPVLHACLLIRTAVLRDLRFETRFDLAADFALLIRLVAENRPWARIPFVAAAMVSGGLSEQQRIRARWQATIALWRHFPAFSQRLATAFAFLRYTTLHLIITYLIRPIPPLRRFLIKRQSRLSQSHSNSLSRGHGDHRAT